MRKLAITAAALAAVGALGAATVAQAGSLGRPCTSASADQWLSLEVLRARVEAEGYRVQKAEIKAACAEIYALDRNGARVELFLDPTSGRIVATQ